MRHYLMILMLTGCASTGQLIPIDYNNPPPADWPKLQERLVYVDAEEMRKICGPRTGNAKGCSNINFRTGVCRITLSDRDPALLAHEREHCRGYDHVDDLNRSRNAWERWKQINGK